ncbi:MAG: hypothetical protein JNM17_36310 [Archangium sp.]|nr:hypothetical protein [Archangium sp.]
MKIRPLISIAVLGLTTLSLVATSRARVCVADARNVSAVTTCGPQANISLTSDTACNVAAAGAAFGGLPLAGFIQGFGAEDAGLDVGFVLSESDGGSNRSCDARPADGGWALTCTDCQIGSADGGCAETCTGTLTPQ